MVSDANPQNVAPTIKPTNNEQVVKRTYDSETSNSADSEVRVRAIPCNQRLQN